MSRTNQTKNKTNVNKARNSTTTNKHTLKKIEKSKKIKMETQFLQKTAIYLNLRFHASLLIMWTPESESTMPLISPTFKAKEASSNGFCMSPRPKKPRSPF